jgi:putative DNA primase/helicase
MSAATMTENSRIESALSHIPADDRDMWTKMGMAIKSELSDDEGFSMWNEWSQGADSYKEADARSFWRSIDANGGVGIGSLYHEAKAHGWTHQGAALTLTPAVIAQRKADRAAAEVAHQKEQAKKHAAARAKAAAIWAAASPASNFNPYLKHKQVDQVDTLREIEASAAAAILEYKPKSNDVELTGRLLIAPVTIGDLMTTCELIDGTGRKSAIFGGDKKGGFWSAQALPTGTGGGLALLIGEGVATVLSATEASGFSGIAALSSNNLMAVAKSMRKRYPLADLVLLADLVKATGKPDPHAVAAAQEVGGRLAVPDFGPDREEGLKDFNDMAVLCGNEAVRQRIAVEAAPAPAPAEDLDAPEIPADWDLVDDEAGTVAALAKAAKEKREARKAAQLASGLPYGFTISNTGVYFTPEGTDDKPGTPIRICSPLRVTALIRDRSSENWGRVIEFNDADGIGHKWAIPAEMLAGDGLDVRRELSRLGLAIGSGMAVKNKLSQYLTESAPKARARCVQQTGWFDNVFVMPDRTIGENGEVVLYQSESKTACQYAQRGTLDEWRDNVASLCAGNSRLIFALSASFAGMILHHAGQESGGVHFVGSSSTGKSTAQLVAASVYGNQAFKQSWRATGNALEGTCALHNDAALILDEMAEVEPKEVGSIVYMIGNGTGKGRAGRAGEMKQRKTWRLMIISSGEIGLAQHMRDGGKIAKAGQEVRMIDIAADAGAGHGLFEELHGYEGGAKLSDAIKEATQAHYGAPAIAFLERLTSEVKTFPATLKQAMSSFVDANLPTDAGGQAARVCNKFAVIAIAGEYATGAGVTGWKQGDAVAAASACFKSWLDSRGGGGNQERTAILSSVKAFFESHGEARFSDIADTSNRVTINRAGFRASTTDGQEYFVLTEAYKRDVCAGFDMKAVTKVLTEAGWIEPDGAGKASQRKRLPDMGLTRCYVFTAKMWEA